MARISTHASLSAPQAASVALQGFLAGIALILLSSISFNFGGIIVSFAFLPVAAIYLWPYQASYRLSIWFVFALGLILEFVSGAPLGVWTLTFVVLFLLIDPVSRYAKPGLFGHWLFFAFLVTLAFGIALPLARLSLGVWPAMLGLFLQALFSVLAFPLVYWIRILIRSLTADPLERGIA